jgi:hypothetical protein
MLTIASCVFLSGCLRSHETAIGGGYVFVDGARDNRWIYKRKNGDRSIVIDQQIVGIQRIDHFVLVRRMVAISYECTDASGERTIVTKRTDDEEYWVIDTRASAERGPLDRSSLLRIAAEFRIGNVDIPEDVSYRPNAIRFESRTSRCVELQPISWGWGMRPPGGYK